MKLYTLLALLLIAPSFASAQIINEGFEEWKVKNGKALPVGWTLSIFGAGRDSSAYSGRYAVLLWNWYSGALGTATVGEFDEFNTGLQNAGIPINTLPVKLTGYYKYELGRNSVDGEKQDSAAIYVMVKRYNTATQKVDTLTVATRLLPPSSQWIPFELALPSTMPGVQPDTAVIIFYSSNPDRPAFCVSENGKCCYLSVDNVSLVGTSGVPYRLANLRAPARVLPNPVVNGAGMLQFDGRPGTRYHLNIYDAAGRLVGQQSVVGSQVALSALHLGSGAYYASIVDDSGMPVGEGQFVVQ